MARHPPVTTISVRMMVAETIIRLDATTAIVGSPEPI
jgi:hypothetical protein